MKVSPNNTQPSLDVNSPGKCKVLMMKLYM